jgi:hypothetical protein
VKTSLVKTYLFLLFYRHASFGSWGRDNKGHTRWAIIMNSHLAGWRWLLAFLIFSSTAAWNIIVGDEDGRAFLAPNSTTRCGVDRIKSYAATFSIMDADPTLNLIVPVEVSHRICEGMFPRFKVKITNMTKAEGNREGYLEIPISVGPDVVPLKLNGIAGD